MSILNLVNSKQNSTSMSNRVIQTQSTLSEKQTTQVSYIGFSTNILVSQTQFLYLLKFFLIRSRMGFKSMGFKRMGFKCPVEHVAGQKNICARAIYH